MAEVNVTYQVYTNGKWLPNVTNLSDYAGSYGSPIQGVYANLDKGSIQYRVHTQNGDWLPWVSDRSDYAGSLGKNIDGIQMQVSGLSGYNVSYRAYAGGRWLPWVVGLEDYAGIDGQPIEAIQVEIVPGNSTGSGNGYVNVTYQVYTNGKWLPNVTNLGDYAGSYGSPIQGVYANLDKGSIQCRVHTQNGDWLPWVSDRSDYAGSLGKNIDGIQMQVSGLSGYNVSYRAYVGGRWLPWVVGLEDYAGIFGQPIEGIQVEIVSGNSTGSGNGYANVTYQVYTYGRWLPNVTNLSDYAGSYGSPIQAVYANLDKGSIQYRVHTQNGDWLPWVSDRSDYAGSLGKNIDGIQMKVSGLNGYNVSYRAYVGGRWLPWVIGESDYAGIYGQSIEAIQVEIVSGNSTGSGTGSGSGDPILPPVTSARKVFIDPGHGGSDPGAIGNWLNEKDVVLSISKKVGNILTKKGISVAYSRTSDTYVSLEGRAQQANSLGSSLFVSIHANSAVAAARGTECYTYPNADAKNKELSRNVSRAIANKFGIPNRGHKEEDFAVLRLTNMPAILVETAFISNANDASLLRSREDDFAAAIAKEILNYFGVSNFDMDDFLKYMSNTGLFNGCGIKLKAIDEKTDITVLSMNPLITLQGEVSFVEKLGGPRTAIDLSVTNETTCKDLLNQLILAGSKFDIGISTLAFSLEKLTLASNVGRFLKYRVEIDTLGVITVTFETTVKDGSNMTAYQRVIVKIYPLKGQTVPSAVTVPVRATTAQQHIDFYDVYIAAHALMLVSVMLAGVAFAGAHYLRISPRFGR